MFIFFWKHRLRPVPCSLSGLKIWARRALLVPDLVAVGSRIHHLRRKGARIGAGCFLSKSKISGNLGNFSLGNHSFIGRAEIQVGTEITIGAHTCINDGVKILGASHDTSDPGWRLISRPVIIGDHVWIATGAMILHGVRIGEGAVIGAGAVVSKDVEPFTIVTGNPAQPTGKSRPLHLDYNPVRFVALHAAWLGPASPASQPSARIDGR